MSKIYAVLLLFAFLSTSFVKAANEGDELKLPKDFFGFQPGADRMLLDYESLIDYMKQISEVSPRVKTLEIGESPMGKKMYMLLFSSPENIQNIDRLKEINKELALNPDLTQSEIETYSKEGKVFILATLSMHSTEVGPSQAAPLVAYELATSTDPALVKQLDDVVFMMVPSSNPDGMDMIVKHYMDSKGTKYEGGSYPKVYHKYVGHDNNRDFVTLTQKDNKAIARIYNTDWYPQILVDKHQMGSTGPRYFVPPMHDPIAENVDEKIWNWTWIFGSNMAKDMAADSLTGVTQNSIFDDYWPGSTETGIWKGVISMLTECASVQLAKPIYVEKNELRGGGSGLAEYKKSINMPAPWEGGWWRLSDIVDYEVSSSLSVVKTASFHKKDILTNRNALCKGEVEKGKTLAPAYFIFPAKQHDQSELIAMLNLLDEHGVQVYKTTNSVTYNGRIIEKGDYIVPLAQPYRAFVKEVLEKQKYPERYYTPGGEMMKPYDITSWSLPLHQGVASFRIDEVVEQIDANIAQVAFPFENDYELTEESKTLVFPVTNNESFKIVFAALANKIDVQRASKAFSLAGAELKTGDFIISATNKNSDKLKEILSGITVKPLELTEEITENTTSMELPKIALVETAFHDMDAGWTRFVFDLYNIPFTVFSPADIKAKELDDYDVIVFPDNKKSLLVDGKYKSSDGKTSLPNYDPKYIKGMEKEGVQKLLKFENEGGTIVCWGESTELFLGVQSIKISDDEKEEFELPVSDISKGIKGKGFYAPGTLFNVELLQDHPLTLGMDKTACIFSEGKPVFGTSIPYFDVDRRVIATYPYENVVASGYAEKDELLEGKPAMVWAKKGKGNFVFYGFNPQFRASTSGTYKLLFNALLLE
ncbi:M14 family metallopeptidase [Draconibacterium sp. IB214405]|uniref:M14 family metallopeptidase n=1 Tax=Draconibacterium sp. IB214405 TaxID=3097352 RepID=UPI002A164EBB|nr:M14 family metallopeptidase [Draconibacterium sp. IB214405]MDX8338599.1 M14 family metallopeptidase [Draconibacterium sp. IB214405]